MRPAGNSSSLPTVQPRFQRTSPPSSSNSAKPRFLLRPRLPIPAALHQCVDAMLTTFRLRRTKRTRFVVALTTLIFLVLLFIALFFRVAHPSLSRFIPIFRSPVRPAILDDAHLDPDLDPDVDVADALPDIDRPANLSASDNLSSADNPSNPSDTDLDPPAKVPDTIPARDSIPAAKQSEPDVPPVILPGPDDPPPVEAAPPADAASAAAHGDHVQTGMRANNPRTHDDSASADGAKDATTSDGKADDDLRADLDERKADVAKDDDVAAAADGDPVGEDPPKAVARPAAGDEDDDDVSVKYPPMVLDGPPRGLPLQVRKNVVVAPPTVKKTTNVVMDPLREKHAKGNVSIVVLFHNEFDSLNTALSSWIRYRLTDYVDEVLFFLNGVDSEAAFRRRVPDFEAKIPEYKRRIVLSKENLALGLAITRMVELAKSEYVLLLEKDWELIENEEVMKSRLTDSKVLISSGVADIVRHRHRDNPGVPLHALIMHQGREESIVRVQKNLLCYVHHWQEDPTKAYPGAGIMRRCGGSKFHLDEENVFCSSSMYCQWTNNPGLFKRDWFMKEVGHEYRKQYKIERDSQGASSPFLDFEYYTNWRSYAWTDKNFTVAVGTGLFSHAETEHRHFNTFWYAHYRVTVDMEEIRKFYLQNETRFKDMGGVHYDPNYPAPLSMFERYPVKFVREFQWEDMYTGTLQTQLKMVDEQYQRYMQQYRMDPKDWASGASIPSKARRTVNWRGEITSMHHVVEKAMMVAPAKMPHEMSITLVTCLLDLDRHSLKEDAFKFRREFKMYLDAMSKWLTHKYKKVVYTSKEIAEEVMKTASDDVKKSTKFVYTTREELRTRWLGPDNYEKIQEIRTSEKWKNTASWLGNSPQAALQDYNPLVMSKMFMMRDAARRNLWNTTHFLFLDAKHNCMNPQLMTDKNDHIIRAHMFNKLLMTTFDYTPADEIHGFAYRAFNQYCNKSPDQERHLLRIGRGGIFGGSAFVLEYITAMYDMALTGSLREGLMGTEETVFSILLYNVKQYVDEFSNNWACPNNLDGDHKCENIKSQGYNCAIIDWATRNAVQPKEDEA